MTSTPSPRSNTEGFVRVSATWRRSAESVVVISTSTVRLEVVSWRAAPEPGPWLRSDSVICHGWTPRVAARLYRKAVRLNEPSSPETVIDV